MEKLTQNIKQSELEIPTRTSIHGLNQQLIQTETDKLYECMIPF